MTQDVKERVEGLARRQGMKLLKFQYRKREEWLPTNIDEEMAESEEDSSNSSHSSDSSDDSDYRPSDSNENSDSNESMYSDDESMSSGNSPPDSM